MDKCPEYIDKDLWKASCMLRIQVRSCGELVKVLEAEEKATEEKNEKLKIKAEEEGTEYIPIRFAQEEGDQGFETKSLVKSLELQISDKITSYSKGNIA